MRPIKSATAEANAVPASSHRVAIGRLPAAASWAFVVSAVCPDRFWCRRASLTARTPESISFNRCSPRWSWPRWASISLRNRDSICVDSMGRKNGNSGPYQGTFIGSTQYLQLDYFAADKLTHHRRALPHSIWNLQRTSHGHLDSEATGCSAHFSHWHADDRVE